MPVAVAAAAVAARLPSPWLAGAAVAVQLLSLWLPVVAVAWWRSRSRCLRTGGAGGGGAAAFALAGAGLRILHQHVNTALPHDV